MAVRVDVNDRVEIKAGDERGGWGIVKLVRGDEYHIALYNGSDVRLYSRDEITKPRARRQA
jgi:hypothetical protein